MYASGRAQWPGPQNLNTGYRYRRAVMLGFWIPVIDGADEVELLWIWIPNGLERVDQGEFPIF
jgi:hypothetical protein